MTKHEPGLWVKLNEYINEYINDIRSFLKLDSLAMAYEPSRPLLWTNHPTAKKSTRKYDEPSRHLYSARTRAPR
jgi:hypothetical protein